MTTMRERAANGLKAGDAFTLTRTFTDEGVEAFARISRDYNPVHFDRRYAGTRGFEGRVCHGLLVASMVTEIGEQLGWLASGMRFRFRRPVYTGDTIRCELTIVEIGARGRARAEARFTNDLGQVVLESEVTGYVPGAEERIVLEAMIREGDPTNAIRSTGSFQRKE
jgi:acyl dehydratase